MQSRKQPLAVLALIVAAIASAASDGGEPGEFGSWDLSESVAGPTIVLGEPETRRVTLEINAEALSDDENPSGSFVVEMFACVANTNGSPARLRGTLLPAEGSGPVAERDAPPCPDTVVLPLSMWRSFSCTSGTACQHSWDVRFERVGSTGTDLQVGWDISSIVTFYGDDDVPPTGADMTLQVEP